MMKQETPLMKTARGRVHTEDLSAYILDGLNRTTAREVAEELGVAASTLHYWSMLFGIEKEVRHKARE